jgi:hypothetical protein
VMNSDVGLFWASLLLALAAVVVFLVLMRRPAEKGRERGPGRPAAPKPPG